MIQFNLLPDVKLEFVRAQRTKHTVISVSVITASSAFVIFLLLFLTVHGIQKKNMGDLNDDIKSYSTELKNTPDLEKVITIQSQLGALPTLHADKAAAGRTFTYVQQLTPSNVSLTDVTVDFANMTISIAGQAPSLDQINTFTDTLKFTKFKTKNIDSTEAFSSVVLSQFSRSSSGATFTITASYNKSIFDNAETVTLTVPNTVSTRSVVGQPTDLFKKPTTTNAAGQ